MKPANTWGHSPEAHPAFKALGEDVRLIRGVLCPLCRTRPFLGPEMKAEPVTRGRVKDTISEYSWEIEYGVYNGFCITRNRGKVEKY